MLDIEALYLEFHARILTYIAWRLKSPGAGAGLAEDLTAEVFLRAFEAVRKGNGPRQPDGSVSGWLFRIAHNLIVDEYRRRTRQPRPIAWDDLWYEADREPSPADAAISAEACALIRDALDGLEGLQPTVITMQSEGYTSIEMGVATGKSEGAVKALLYRGRVQLGELLRENGFEVGPRSTRRYTLRRAILQGDRDGQ